MSAHNVAAHLQGWGVVLDVVYNHVYAAGPSDRWVHQFFEREWCYVFIWLFEAIATLLRGSNTFVVCADISTVQRTGAMLEALYLCVGYNQLDG